MYTNSCSCFLITFSYDELLREKEELDVAFERFQLDVKHTQTGNAAKEIRVLKKVINNLEVNNV